MCLQALISLCVSFQAFFAKDYISNHPEDGDKITRLRELMFEQVMLAAQNPFHAVKGLSQVCI